MSKNFLFILDDIATLNPKKDTSLALIAAANRAGQKCFFSSIYDFTAHKNGVQVLATEISLGADYRLQKIKQETLPLAAAMNITDFDVIFMRKDPPITDAYLTCTQFLSLAESQGVRVVNPPATLRNFNEKLSTLSFKELIPDYCFSSQKQMLKDFAGQHEKVILKPIDAMGGQGVFITHATDPNFDVICETLTQSGTKAIMAQKFIPDIVLGDKRILVLHGKIVPYALARIPVGHNIRGNLAAGGRYEVQALTVREQEIAEAVSVFLQEHHIALCGLDVIGGHLTEINITSPTCFLEISAGARLDLAEQFMQFYI